MHGLPTFCYIFFVVPPAIAAESYTITASSLYHPGDSTGGESTIITADDLVQNQDTFVQEALREAPSVILGSTGDNGRLTRFSIRGALNGENLVLVDGVPVNDPSSSGGTFDFANELVDDLQQVEILPGANSVIYGSDAMGGIINLVTKTGKGPFQARFNTEGGSFRSRKGSLGFTGQHKRLSYAFTGAGFAGGKGTFTNKVHHNRQGDKYRTGLGSGRLSYAISPHLELSGALRWNESKTRFDNLMAGLPVRADNTLRTRQNVSHIQTHGSFFRGLWEHIFRVSRSETRRRSHMPGFSFTNRGLDHRLHSRSDLHWSSNHISTLGAEYGWERVNTTFSGRHRRDHQAIFAQHFMKLWTGNEWVLGSRFDHFESVGERVTYRAGINQDLGKTTRIRASYGTGFKAPLLSDQFNTSRFSLANRNLRPEKNYSADVGIDQKFFKDKAEVNLTAFLNVINNVFTSRRVGSQTQRINGGKRVSRGVEAKLRATPCKWLSFHSNLTFMVAQDRSQGRTRRSPHVPRLVVNGKVVFTPWKDARLFTSTHYVSTQKDGASRRGLKPYATLTVGGDYDITQDVQVYGRVENLTDKRYEETFGYGVRGRAFYLGLRAKI